jgi:glycosyltransferase involved in cell wall biosynthesis
MSSYALARWGIASRHRIAHLICPCHYAADRHRQAGFAQDSLSVIPYFCELAPLAEPRPLPRAPMISFVGRVTKYKGADLFVEILSKLPQRVRGQMVGDMNARNRAWLKGLAREHGVADRLILREWVDRTKIRSVFEETSVFVFPSIWPETLGIVGLEALATGVPVVAFEVGGVPEWLIPEKTGKIARLKDAADAGQAIRELIDNPSLQQEMGRNGLALIAERFSIDLHVAQLLAVYRGAAPHANT